MDNIDEAVLAVGVVDEVAANMKMGLTSQMSLITFKTKSGLNYQMIHEKGLHRNLYAPSSWKIKINKPTVTPTTRRITRIG